MGIAGSEQHGGGGGSLFLVELQGALAALQADHFGRIAALRTPCAEVCVCVCGVPCPRCMSGWSAERNFPGFGSMSSRCDVAKEPHLPRRFSTPKTAPLPNFECYGCGFVRLAHFESKTLETVDEPSQTRIP